MAIDEIASPTSSVLSQHQGSHLKSTGREHGSESCSIDAKSGPGYQKELRYCGSHLFIMVTRLPLLGR
ncbi:unnamed protein product [Fusarium fujikuroi]|uniref:Uncharacterized protein n=1 Tax=Fusarium fujikuroi TaxID=5127 RepID=A0A9Q9UDH1_FUSFU|nr:unnamed protein product [Fusarium fujikuroi]VZI21494.1 unnamed protein product [Fusarium fujikuroi]